MLKRSTMLFQNMAQTLPFHRLAIRLTIFGRECYEKANIWFNDELSAFIQLFAVDYGDSRSE